MVNVAMPTGLVVTELLTNALKHAFIGRDGGTVTLHSLSDGRGCKVIVADDGNGLPDGAEWPRPGKLSSLIVRSLRENEKAGFQVESAAGQGHARDNYLQPRGSRTRAAGQWLPRNALMAACPVRSHCAVMRVAPAGPLG